MILTVEIDHDGVAKLITADGASKERIIRDLKSNLTGAICGAKMKEETIKTHKDAESAKNDAEAFAKRVGRPVADSEEALIANRDAVYGKPPVVEPSE